MSGIIPSDLWDMTLSAMVDLWNIPFVAAAFTMVIAIALACLLIRKVREALVPTGGRAAARSDSD